MSASSGKAQRVGSHVGYKADCTVAFDVNAFVKLRAIDIVRRGVMPSRRLASCWWVDVINGGDGLRCFLPRLTVFTLNGASFVALITVFTSSWDLSSSLSSFRRSEP